MSDLHVVFGAGGGAGAALVRTLAAQGLPVRAVTRRDPAGLPPGVAHVRADARDARAVREACRGARVVYHCVNVPYPDWQALLPGILDNLIDGASDAGATLVYCDNLYLYGRPAGPMRETDPAAATTRKGILRARLADRLLTAHADGRVQAAIARASDFFGPGATNTVAGQLVFSAVAAGKRSHWIGSLDVPHTLSYIDDVARALVTLGTDPRALGEVWHLPAAPPVTGRAFIEMVFAAAGTSPRMGLYRRWMMQLLSLFSRDMREIVEILYQFEVPFVLDDTKFRRTFGDTWATPLHEAVARTLAWERMGRPSPVPFVSHPADATTPVEAGT